MEFYRRKFNPYKYLITVCILTIFLFLIVERIRGYDVERQTRRVDVLNNLKPRSYDYLVSTASSSKKFNKQKLQTYKYYYQKLTEYMPERAEAYGLLGFCFYNMDEEEKAIAAYQSAIKIAPRFFWYHFNLGLIYFKSGDYQSALEKFHEAVNTNAKDAIFFIRSSRRIYLPIIKTNKRLNGFSDIDQLRQAYKQCQILKILSQNYLRSDVSVGRNIIEIGDSIHFEIF